MRTGWRLLSESAWAWVFTTPTHTLYVISPSRGHEVALKVLGPEFAGFLLTDCMGAYDARPYKPEKKPKCNGHFLKDLKAAEVAQLLAGDLEATWPRAVIDLLKSAIELKRKKPELPAPAFEQQRRSLDINLDVLLGHVEKLTHGDNIKMAKRLLKHRAGVLLFLDHHEVEPTNNHSERQIRPFVIFRKLSGGNRSELGAAALATLASVWATACQQGLSFASIVLQALRNRGQSALPLPGA
jgi:transposase